MSRHRPFTQPEIDIMCRMRVNGASYAAIARRFQCAGDTVSRLIHRAVTDPTHTPARPPWDGHPDHLYWIHARAMERLTTRQEPTP